MRSSSIKTAAVLTVTLALTAIAPVATARPTRLPAGTPSVVQQFEQAADRATTAVRRLISRFFTPSANGLPQPPLPDDTSLLLIEEESTTTTTTTTRTKKP